MDTALPERTRRPRRRRRLDVTRLLGRNAGPSVRVLGRGEGLASPSARPARRGRVRRRAGLRWLTWSLPVLLLLAAAVVLWTAPVFRVQRVQVHGAQGLSPALIERALNVRGRPLWLVWPGQAERRLLELFPNLAQAEVRWTWPAGVVVQVVERPPVMIWEREGRRLYLSREGIGWLPFPEEPAPAVRVLARGPLPTLPQPPRSRSQVLPPEMVSLAVQLHAVRPEGADLLYDPDYGLGWRDPQGWEVFFGRSPHHLAARLEVLQAVISRLQAQGRSPARIVLADLAAPFVVLTR